MAIRQDVEDKIKPSDRLNMSDNVELDLNKKYKQREWFKPDGLWYGFGDNWLKFVRIEMPEREGDYLFKLDIDETSILKIKNLKELIVFTVDYGINERSERSDIDFVFQINWPKVAKEYKGIEIDKINPGERMTLQWYRTWDIASGCIWDTSAIKNVVNLEH